MEQLEKDPRHVMVRAMPDPTSNIVTELISRLDAREFSPFVIMLSDGSHYEIPTRDHCTVTRLLRRVELEHDNGSITHLNPLHITRLVARKPAA
jgi:hypothetical protein